MNLKFIVGTTTLLYLSISAADELNLSRQPNTVAHLVPSSGASVVDEVVVESSLYIKPKKKLVRRTRNLADHALIYRILVKRSPQNSQFRSPFSQSQSASNAAANSHFGNTFGFGSSAANAQAQGFFAQGPAASFGASSAATHTQSLTGNMGGVQGAAGASLSQSYTLPNGKVINFANSNNFANGPNGNAASRATSIQIN